MNVLYDSEGYIVNAAVLKPEVLHMQYVRCPACAEFPFFRWPSGWDGHAQMCKGIDEGTVEERKAEFKMVLGHLF
jgi:hypothetical protein